MNPNEHGWEEQPIDISEVMHNASLQGPIARPRPLVVSAETHQRLIDSPVKRDDKDVTEEQALKNMREALDDFERERSAGIMCATGPLTRIAIAAQQLWEA